MSKKNLFNQNKISIVLDYLEEKSLQYISIVTPGETSL